MNRWWVPTTNGFRTSVIRVCHVDNLVNEDGQAHVSKCVLCEHKTLMLTDSKDVGSTVERANQVRSDDSADKIHVEHDFQMKPERSWFSGTGLLTHPRRADIILYPHSSNSQALL